MKKLLLMLVVTLVCFTLHAVGLLQEGKKITTNEQSVTNEFSSLINTPNYCPITPRTPLNEIHEMLNNQSSKLSTAVIHNVLTILKCANKYNIERNHMLTIIDYSLSASEKRLWVFDLAEKKLLFHTYVSHGIKSGSLLSTSFSNKYDSKSSSIGVYKTEKIYYGRDGISLKLNGLEHGFNDHAFNRSIVMHGGWYVDEPFIKKYGRAGRSWGCPALPLDLAEPIIDAIKDNSLFVIYYPDETWLLKSKFLSCDPVSSEINTTKLSAKIVPVTADEEQQDDVLFTHAKEYNKNLENEIVAVTQADKYALIFHKNAPLKRMLRRQINNIEYIALSDAEFKQMISTNNLTAIYFVMPAIKMLRGYYVTEMKIVNLGPIKDVRSNINSLEKTRGYMVHFGSGSSVNLSSTHRFIRWIGL